MRRFDLFVIISPMYEQSGFPGVDLAVNTKLNDALSSELCFKMAIISSLLLVEGYLLYIS